MFLYLSSEMIRDVLDVDKLEALFLFMRTLGTKRHLHLKLLILIELIGSR